MIAARRYLSVQAGLGRPVPIGVETRRRM